MTDEYGRKLRYKPNPDANLVLQADRSQLPRRDMEPTGEPETLYGKINPKEFGSRAKQETTKRKDITSIKPTKKALKPTHDYGSILSATDDLEDLKYRPKSRETQQTYELILSFVERKLGDQTQEIIRSGTDLILEILKQEDVKDLEKKKEIDSIIESELDIKEFSDIVALSNKLTDYHDSQNDEKDEDIEDNGVAVVFDEKEETEESDASSNISQDDGVSNKETLEGSEEETDKILIDKSKTKSTKLVPVKEIDSFWLQRQMGRFYVDPLDIQQKSDTAFEILQKSSDARDCENKLMELFEYSNFELVHTLTVNRERIVWCIKLSKAGGNTQERQTILSEIENSGLSYIVRLLEDDTINGEIKEQSTLTKEDFGNKEKHTVAPKNDLDLQTLEFTQGSRLMTNKKCHLPDGSFKKSKKGYEEIHIPIQKQKPMEKDEVIIKTEQLPEFAQLCFSNTSSLNRIQSKVFPVAFETDDNMLLCAPTGAGKTNVALLTILREIGKYLNHETKKIDTDKFKIVYIAPMKALVQEMVSNFSQRLSPLNITVNELTGDRQLTKQQIVDTQLIVTTPEKWDVITRKQSDTSYTNLVKLIVIDEIHLLHDERGPVIESIVCRTIHYLDTKCAVRLIGLSATLPNYLDVAAFMNVDPEVGLFFFDNTYRPCPLKQEFIGITEKKAIKRFRLMNEITYDKILNDAGKNQVLIFVHSRKETFRTAKSLRDLSIEKETLGLFLGQGDSKATLEQVSNSSIKDNSLREVLPHGFAIHHAGLSRNDRSQVEDLFSKGHIKVLVSTATLAWGVNLPAHTVIIKGTQVYSPEKGRWCELSPQDVLQMLGRAGRPQFDSYGEGIIITTNTELQYYLSLLNQQLPIESQLISKLTDTINAEIVLGNIKNRNDGIDWIKNTYLFIRMIKNGASYGVQNEELTKDPLLTQRRVDLVHSALNLLEDCQLIKYDTLSGRIQSTELGRIASHYYITYKSMYTYNLQLKPNMEMIEILRVFTLSEEFKLIPVREEEKAEISKLIERVPIPIKESVEDKSSKVNVLLQSYISQLKLEGFALTADMVYVTQSSIRILRAMFEIALKRGWASLSRNLLDLCKIVEKRSWLSMSPLRLFNSMPLDLIKKIEKKDFPWDRFYDLSPEEIGELVGIHKAGKLIYKYVHHFPRLDLHAVVQPITRSLVRFEITVTPDFDWDEKIHGKNGELFRVFVEDVNREILLFQDIFILKMKYSKEDHYLSFTVPLFEPLSPCYFISFVSDRWLHALTTLPVSFKNLFLPEKNYPHTELYDMQPLPSTCFGIEQYNNLYSSWISYFNPIQTQVFNSLYSTEENVVLCAPSGSGKTICAEFAILKNFCSENERSQCLYIAPKQEIIDECFKLWSVKFSKINKLVTKLTGELNTDLILLSEGDLIMSTPEQWDVLSRRWKQRTNIQKIGLVVADELHLISGQNGPTYEVVLSRMRYIASQTKNQIRFVALSVPLANYKDIAHWLGASNNNVYNFSCADRCVPLELRFQTFNIPHYSSMLYAMIRPAYTAIKNQADNKPVIVFVSDRKQCKNIAVEFVGMELTSNTKSTFLSSTATDLDPIINAIEDPVLKQTISHGIGFYHNALSEQEKAVVMNMFKQGIIQILVSSYDSCYSMSNITSYMTIIMGTSYYEGKEHRYIDYSISDVLKMMGRSGRQNVDDHAKCILMTKSNQKEYYKKFANEGLPIESHLDQYLHDHFNAEIVTKTIENKQDAVDYLTWSFMYRRMSRNPNYYNLNGTSNRHLSDHLSELVETTVKHLSDSKCISVEDDMDLFPLNLGMICAYYNVNYSTIEIFSQSLTPKTKLRGLLEIISSSTEFESIPIRHHEDIVLSKIAQGLNLPSNFNENDFHKPSVKANLLIQSYFSRFKLPHDLQYDQSEVVGKVVPLIQACVDVISSKGWFGPAIVAMEICQMFMQAQWDRESTLKQIPHFSDSLIEKAKSMQITLVSDIKEIEDDQRNELLKDLSPNQIRDIANFVNKFPIIDMEFKLLSKPEECLTGQNLSLEITLVRETDEEEEDDDINIDVEAPFYPKPKKEGWWVVVGDTKENSLLGIKRLTLKKEIKFNLTFVAPSFPGKHSLKVVFISDSYLGCDQEYELELDVFKGESDGESQDDNEQLSD